MHFTEIIAMIGLAFGALLGLGGLLAPNWAAGVVRLQADPDKPGGYSEFRATYGGLFLLTHLSTLVLMLNTPPSISVLVALPMAAGWFGAALGRVFSMVLDRSKGGDAKIIPIWMGTELGLALAIAAPILQFTS